MNKFHLLKTSPLAALMLLSLAACGLVDPAAKIFNAAELHLSRGEYREAIKAHSELIDRYPENPLAPESLFKKGHIYYRYLDEKEKAIKAYDELAYLYPASPRLASAAKNKGAIYSELGEHWKAVKEYEWLLEKAGDGEIDSYQYLVGMEYFKMNDFRQARIEFAEIVQRNTESPLAPDIRFRIATSFYLEGKLNKSLAAYESIIELFEGHPLAFESSVNIAQIHTDAGRLDKALEVLRALKTTGAHPDHELIDMRIALIEERIKKSGQKRTKRRR